MPANTKSNTASKSATAKFGGKSSDTKEFTKSITFQRDVTCWNCFGPRRDDVHPESYEECKAMAERAKIRDFYGGIPYMIWRVRPWGDLVFDALGIDASAFGSIEDYLEFLLTAPYGNRTFTNLVKVIFIFARLDDNGKLLQAGTGKPYSLNPKQHLTATEY